MQFFGKSYDLIAAKLLNYITKGIAFRLAYQKTLLFNHQKTFGASVARCRRKR